MRLASTWAFQRLTSPGVTPCTSETAKAQVVVTEFAEASRKAPSQLAPSGSGSGAAPVSAQESRCVT